MSTVTSRLFLHTFPTGSVITVTIGDEIAYVNSCDLEGLSFEQVEGKTFKQSRYLNGSVTVVAKTAKGRLVVALSGCTPAEADPAFASAIAFAEQFA